MRNKFVWLTCIVFWIIVIFMVFCVSDAAGAAQEVDRPIAERVIRALVEAAEGNEWEEPVAIPKTETTTGIDHLAGIDPEQVVTLDKPRWTAEEAQMLVTLAMAEAEGEDTEGKALVILVVLNRAESDSFPDSIEEVIFQENQFSPAKPGHRYYTVAPNADCWAALEMVESGWDESQGALYFERNAEKETWHSKNLIELFVHGKHTFYTEEDIAK